MQRKRQDGFSLVELAIVLIIIGLIIGGVLKGQDLIQSARLNDIQATMNEIRTASATFQDKYGGFPGDFDEASTYVDDTNANNGDGNGRVDLGARAAEACADDGESCLFWQHISLAGLIGGVGDLNADSATYGPGGATLTASIGGYYSILYGNTNVPGTGGASNHWVLLGGGKNTGVNDDAVLSPIDLRSIDLKADDGQSNSGDIRALNGNGVSAGATGCTTATDAAGEYTAAEDELCAGFFAL